MNHNTQIMLNGKCNCKCHHIHYAKCTCQLTAEWREILGATKPLSKKPGKTKLESRVKAFAKRYGNPTTATTNHGFHSPIQEQTTWIN